jgi:hypothetical protein
MIPTLGPGHAAPLSPAADAGAAAVRRALVDALGAHHYTDPEVRTALGRFVRQAREAGAPPERVVVDLKALIRPFESPATAAGAHAPALREELVWWGITLYYLAD